MITLRITGASCSTLLISPPMKIWADERVDDHPRGRHGNGERFPQGVLRGLVAGPRA